MNKYFNEHNRSRISELLYCNRISIRMQKYINILGQYHLYLLQFIFYFERFLNK